MQLELASRKRMGIVKRLLSNLPLFYMIVKGDGIVALNSAGQLMRREVTKDRPLVVDNENVVAWTAGLTPTPKLATRKGGKLRRAATSFITGEGIVMKFTGNGTVYLQTRVDRFARLERRIRKVERGSSIIGI